jgi:SH3-like domain-containing protein
MISAGASVVVCERYAAQFANPIALAAGETVRVAEPDPEYPQWYWCRGPDGREGWVHQDFLSQLSGAAIALSDYDARELNVEVGMRMQVLRVCGAWLYVETDDGRVGWVPGRVVHDAA